MDRDRPVVLVVHADPGARRHLVDSLQSDFTVVTATDADDLPRAIAEEAPDLVVAQLVGPPGDSRTLLERARAGPRSAPVVLVAPAPDVDVTVEALEAGAADCLAEPVSARHLLARCRVALELGRGRRLQQALERSTVLLDQAQRLARLGSWEIDLADQSITGSATFREMTGLTAYDLDRRAPGDLLESVVHPDDLPRVLEKLVAAAGGAKVEDELRIVTPSGETRIIHAHGEPATGPDGARLLRGSFQDVTDQRALWARVVAAEREREAADQERRIARELQASLLPRVDPDVPGLEVGSFYHAGVVGTEVGGDWYDVIELGHGRTALVIGDVMGRGVRAAAVMGQLRAATRAFAELDLAGVDVLAHLDRLVHDLAGDQIVTCVYAVVDVDVMRLSYANAGHLPPLRVDVRGAVEALEAVGPPLGAGYHGQRDETLDLATDDVLLLYTDGLVERRGEDLSRGLDRIGAALSGSADLPVADLLDAVVTGADGHDVDDDVALVAVRLRPEAGPPALRVTVGRGPRALRDVRRAVARQAAAWGAPAERGDDVVLVVNELVTSASLEAGRPLEVVLRKTGDAVLVEVLVPGASGPPGRRTEAPVGEEHASTIVTALAHDWGSRQHADGSVRWALVDWSRPESLTQMGGGGAPQRG